MIVLLPGLGGDHRMYAGAWRTLPDVWDLAWQPGDFDHGVPGAAEAVRARLPGTPDMLIGSSLGGMVTLELAHHMPVSRIVLVGSATNRAEINPWLRGLAPLAEFWPWRPTQTVGRLLPSAKTRVFADQDHRLLTPMLESIVQWQGSFDRQAMPARCLRLHGRYDPIIRPTWAHHWCRGDHVIAMSHARQCVVAITQWCQSVLARGKVGIVTADFVRGCFKVMQPSFPPFFRSVVGRFFSVRRVPKSAT
jgi:pimeloyl-ACP methyl ester carboxylesterase